MKVKIGAYLMMLAGVMVSLSACEGGSNATVPVSVTALSNPVLANFSTTVVANFANYTSLVKYGSKINFSIAPFAASNSNVSFPTASFSRFSTVTQTSVRTAAGGRAWVTVRSPLPGKFLVTATSDLVHGTTNFGGSTSVSFINQPAAVEVMVGFNKPLTKVGTLTFDVVSTQPAPVFVNFSGIQSPFIWNEDTTPLLPPGGVPDNGATNLIIGSLQGINIAALTPQFKYDFVPIAPSVPTFSLANIICNTADINATPLFPSMFLRTRYFDAAGNEMFF